MEHHRIRSPFFLTAVFSCALLSCPAPVGDPPPPAPGPGPTPAASFSARWARTAENGLGCAFRAVAADAAGNVYAAGYLSDDDTGSFGPGASASGKAADARHPLIVKYDSAGKALWARTVAKLSGLASYGCDLNAVAADGAGNVYAAGSICNGTYDFGSGVSVTLAGSLLAYPFLIKYDAAGNALWAVSVESSTVLASFSSICVQDNTSNVYACGTLSGSGKVDFGASEVATVYPGANPVLVKYDALGRDLWSRSLESASGRYLGCDFRSVDSDGSGNAVVAGSLQGDRDSSNVYDFGSGVSAATAMDSESPLLVKYSDAGAPLWARTLEAGAGQCVFDAVAVDGAGNAYAAGRLYGDGTAAVKDFRFAPGVSVWREYKDSAVAVKYSPAGAAQWARTVVSGAAVSSFAAVAVSPDRTVLCAGSVSGKELLDFGGKTVSGCVPSGASALLVRYDAAGGAKSVHSALSGAWSSSLAGIAAGPLGTAYAAGSLSDEGRWTFGGGAEVETKEWCTHPLLLKYGE